MIRKLIIATLILGPLLVAAGFGIHAALVADEAEHNLMAVRCIARSLEDYFWNEGKWPENYEALEHYSVRSRIYDWPEDREEILKRVEVDFDLTIEEVASSQAPHHFLRYRTPMFETIVADDLADVVYSAQQRLEKDRGPSSP